MTLSINTARFLSITLVALSLTGCLGTEEDFEASQHEIIVFNGASAYNLQTSGLRAMDARYAGLSATGLASNTSWISWMAQGATSWQTFTYLVGCALDATQTIPAITVGGTTYGPWVGQLGLAPTWATVGNKVQTQDEQELVTACLLARFNPSGAHVMISARSITMAPPSAAEFASYSAAEAQFFGNLFVASPQMGVCRADGANAATDSQLLSDQRYCALNPAQCGFTDYGDCSDACSDFDNYQSVFGTCQEYQTLATFISPAS